MTLHRVLALLLACAPSCATPVDDDTVVRGFDTDAAGDHVVAPDAPHDGLSEAAADASHDAAADATTDGATDATTEAAADAAHDAATDPATDGVVGNDAAVDATDADTADTADALSDAPVDVNSRDPAVRCLGTAVAVPLVAPAGTPWATSVDSFSTEYGTTTWSATQALGAPDTYPSFGDLTTAWATQSPDVAGDYIALAFSPATAGSEVWIYETYNPDAVSKVTITTASGDSVVYQQASVSSVGSCAFVVVAPTQTAEPISKIRIDLASEQLSTWNEIDAVGIVP